MPNGVTPVGDDQTWKREVDRKLAELQRQIQVLQGQVRR